MKEINYGQLATITGRYYAMDRDKRWERVKLAYEGLTEGKGEISTDPVKVKYFTITRCFVETV
jgi:2,3-bisphosphoglycerate-independent phosphoglycerate mutase